MTGNFTARNLGIMWLRDRARDLQAAAIRVEDAYKEEPLRSTCQRVASAYRRAATVLDRDWSNMEQEHDV